MAFCTNCGKRKDNAGDTCTYCGALGKSVIEENIIAKRNGEVEMPDNNDTENSAMEQQSEASGINLEKASESGHEFSAHEFSTQQNNRSNSNGASSANNANNTQNKSSQNTPVIDNENKVLSNAMKVLIVALCFLIPGIGSIVGVVVAIVLMTRPIPDYRSFGKSLLILNVIMIVFSIIMCIVMAASLGVIASELQDLINYGIPFEGIYEEYYDFPGGFDGDLYNGFYDDALDLGDEGLLSPELFEGLNSIEAMPL